MQYYGAYSFPDWVPLEYGKQVIEAYRQYQMERDRDIAEGVRPSTDEIQPWGEFLFEYVGAELEAAI